MNGILDRWRQQFARVMAGARAGTATDHLLSSKGYARYCDFGGPASYCLDGTESVQTPEFFREHFADASGLVWIRTGTGRRDGLVGDLDLFARHALPTIRQPFILLTGDGDLSVPSEVDPSTVALLLGSEWLVAWYTQNHDGGGDGRIRPLPIGLDLHSPDSFATPGERARALSAIAARRKPPRQQPLKVFCDLAVSLASVDRAVAVSTLKGYPHVVRQHKRLPRTEIWRRYASHPFVLSTRGNGLDCYRTWEALYLGSIVIAPRSSLAPLYRDLPVVMIDDWRQVRSLDNLQRWLDRYADLAAPERIARLLDVRSRMKMLREMLPSA